MAYSNCLHAIGLMSGTSMDGIDAALLTTDGEIVRHHGASIFLPYDDTMRALITDAIKKKKASDTLIKTITILHATAVIRLLKKAKLCLKDIDVIGFHGQTIAHHPDQGYTLQIGDGPMLAKELGIPVVYDFRSEDVRAGGQGAPLVPVYHRAVTTGAPYPFALINIGGVANITWIGEDGSLCAFDTGPGNALINDTMKRLYQLDYDPEGTYAAKGTPIESILEAYASHPYLLTKPPKSLDRNMFHFLLQELAPYPAYDQLATLTAFTARCIIQAGNMTPTPPKAWAISGGGRHNLTLMNMLCEKLGRAHVKSIDLLGLNGDMLEAYAFAFLAVRSLRKLPLTYPETTGVQSPTLGGVFCPALPS